MVKCRAIVSCNRSCMHICQTGTDKFQMHTALWHPQGNLGCCVYVKNELTPIMSGRKGLKIERYRLPYTPIALIISHMEPSQQLVEQSSMQSTAVCYPSLLR